MQKFYFLLIFLLCPFLTADVKVHNIFGDNMILQQKTGNAIWGIAEPGEKVTVKASWGSESATTADSNGKWKVLLKTPAHGTGFSLSIEGNNSLKIKNVAIGEVWLCAGQSNMGWSVGNCFDGEQDASLVDLPNLRIFKSQRELWHEPMEFSRDRLAQWKPGNPQSAAETSAVSFYFAQKLQKELGIPVGIIVQAFAGTPIEGWMPKEIQTEDPRTAALIKDLEDKATKMMKSGTTKKSALTKFYKELDEYNALIDAGKIMQNATRVQTPPIITKPANLGHQMPSHIFNAMINPIRPYGIKGMLWYQGERNSKDAAQSLNYGKQLAQMINYYRSSWYEMSEANTDKNFPVQFTQLPSWHPAQKVPVEGPEAVWAITCDVMRKASHDINNSYMAVSIDTGGAYELHPRNKKPIGIRHAYLALKNTYGKNIVDYDPRYKSHKIESDKVIIEFDSLGSGLMAGKEGKINSFAIAGKDQKWHWAEAKIEGDKLVISSGDVAKPAAVRYAWAMNPSKRNLIYNKEGLPASPFRTDNWDLYNPEAKIITVAKPKSDKKPTKDWDRPAMTQ